MTAIETIEPANITQQIFIRGEAHSVPQALQRSVTHIAYHAGQITMIARTVHAGDWQWLTIQLGASQQHNRQTWDTAASRGVLGRSEDDG